MNSNDPQQHKATIYEEIENQRHELTGLAKRIHETPELGYQEHKAAQWLCEAAALAGFAVEKPFGGLETAFRASKKGKGDGPTIAFLCEYDALPDLGHACGHNLIGAASLGAAMGLSGLMEELPGTLQLIGTPAEEGEGGKVKLVEAGAFEGVDAAMMFHPSKRNMIGSSSLARHKFKMEFHGKSAHASGSPDKGINALDAAILTFNGVNALRQHIPSDARIHGVILEGGKAPNIIPDYAQAMFYVRALDNDYCNALLERVKNCAKGAALATGATVEFTMMGSYQSYRPNQPFADVFKENATALGVEYPDLKTIKGLGSSDIGNVSQTLPAIHPYLSIGSGELAGHSTEFMEASGSETGLNTMMTAAKALAATGYDLFTTPSLMQEIKKEFERLN